MTTATLSRTPTSAALLPNPALDQTGWLFDGMEFPAPVEQIAEESITPATAEDADRLIDSIRMLSPTVSREWLAAFSVGALREYLAHLRAASKPRGRTAIWVRPRVASAISAAAAPE